MAITYLDDNLTTTVKPKSKITYLDEQPQVQPNDFLPGKERTEKLISERPDAMVAFSKELNYAPTKEDIVQHPVKSAVGLALKPATTAMKAINALWQRGEGAVANVGMQEQETGDKAPLGRRVLEATIPPLAMSRYGKSIKQGLTGERKGELGDIPRRAGVPEPLSAGIGLGASMGIGGLGGKAGKVEQAIGKTTGRGLERTGALVSGIEPEILAETRKLGFRNVLDKKYYNKKVPEQIIDTIDQNIEGLKATAGNKYKEITTPIRKEKFDYNQILNDLNRLSLKIKQNPFKGPTKGLDTRIVDTLRSPSLKVKSLGDVLDLRRFLDQELFTAKGQGIKSAYGKEVRDIFNKYLHKNETLAKADNEWYTLQRILEDNQKITGETGEALLNRWTKLTTKQKENLSLLEKELLNKSPEATPFIDDLTKYSLAQQYLSRASQSSPTGILGKAIRPVFRGYLRAFGTKPSATVPFKTLKP
jgi:hypothetical protein